MPNFTATTRLSYRDISGLLVSCTRADIEEDIGNPGYAKRWKNRAAGLPSLPLVRVPSDTITFQGGRFGDFVQNTKANQVEIATVLGQQKLKFNRASQQFFTCSIPTFPATLNGGAIAYQFTPGSDNSDTQMIYDDGQSTKVVRRQGGLRRFQFGVTTLVGAGDMTAGRWLAESSGTLISAARDRTLDNASQAGVSNLSATAGTAYLGRSTTGDYLDGYLDSFHIWARRLSPLEIDFLWDTLDEDNVSYASNDYASVATSLWTDETGQPGTNQINRIRDEVSVNQYFKLVTVTGNGVTPQRVQVAASEDGIVKPDSLLNDGVFSMRWIEYPSALMTPPQVVRTAGWSSVADILVDTAGHYCLQVYRLEGGSVFLHFDVEVIS